MTGDQKAVIERMRSRGLVYAEIANALCLSINTVKSFCRRNNLSKSNASEVPGITENKEHCASCEKKLLHTIKAKPKRFCDDKCRRTWWNHHRGLLKCKSACRLTCAHCGSVIDSYGNMGRKYCSHPCYIADRFSVSSTIKAVEAS